jgi:hypothetical protein
MPARNENQEDEITVHRDFVVLDLPYALEAVFIKITYQIYALKQVCLCLTEGGTKKVVSGRILL